MSAFVSFRRPYQDSLISKQERCSSLISVSAYDPNRYLFVCDDDSLGFGFECVPIHGLVDGMESQVNNLLNESYPAGTQIQFIYYRSPDCNRRLYEMEMLRYGNKDPLLSNLIKRRTAFIDQHTKQKLTLKKGSASHDLGIFVNVKLFVTVKVPFSPEMFETDEVENVTDLRTKVFTTLSNLKLSPSELDADGWLRAMGTMVNWSENSSWRTNDSIWDQTQPLHDQVFDYDSILTQDKNHIQIGDTYLSVMSAKRFPTRAYFGKAMEIIRSDAATALNVNFKIVITLTVPNQDKEKFSIDNKRTYQISQSNTPIAKYIPSFGEKLDHLTNIYKSFSDEGAKIFKCSYHVIAFAPTKLAVNSAATQIMNLWSTFGYKLMVDKSMQLPVLLNCLPLCSDRKSSQDLFRSKTLTTEHISPLIPFFGEWHGTAECHSLLTCRSGQVMGVSLHSGLSNMNAVISAASGKGKSLFANMLIADYLSVGARVWVIDNGESYKKTCEQNQGEFIECTADSDLQMNPFINLTSLDGTNKTALPGMKLDVEDPQNGAEEMINALITSMISVHTPLVDLQISSLSRVIREVWLEKFNSMIIDDIEERLLAHTDKQVRDMGTQLYDFTSKGRYGDYFNRGNNIHFDNRFCVLELKSLGQKPHLQQVVLLMMMFQISEEMFRGDKFEKKLLFIDEAWAQLTAESVARFIEDGYRRFRKFNGSIVIITQSMLDIFNNPRGEAIAANSATKFYLGQEGGTINKVRSLEATSLSEYDFVVLESVHTIQGVYSEIFIHSEQGSGIGRLICDPYARLLFSSKPEDDAMIAQLTKSGLSMSDAINHIIDSNGAQHG